ncbi:RAD51-associated protein 1 isoform X2 [Misgurnus anguillicaudatus]|uniref:RAD51-associated protein 1 isoform X2 n=1 Tax=Misgurnus anguillicaudatus TaxID=75329 RepID=UPI003CCFCF61
MDRPPRSRKSVNYSDFQDDDDEDFASAKPPSKKARTAGKDPDSERNQKNSSASSSEVVDLTSSGHGKRVSLKDKLYERDLEAALTLSLLDRSGTEERECTTKTEAHERSESPPPVLTHCNADEHQHRPDSPPVLSNCSVDGNSLGLNLIIDLKTSPPSVSKKRKVSEQKRNPLKEKDNDKDEDYDPQNTPDSESDANFTEEEEESEDETFTVTKKTNVKKMGQKTEKKTTQAAKPKKEKKEKTPAKASKVKNSAPTPVISRSPAASVSVLKTPTTPPLSKPALCSSPAGGRLPKWNPPGLVGRSPSASQNASVKSPGQGLRLGLSRLARIKPLHSNAAAH